MPSQTEVSLISRAREGDQAAFTSLYRRFHARVFSMFLPRTGDCDETDDLVQMTFIRAFCHLGTFRGEAPFPTWLTRIALNVWYDWLEQRRQRSECVTTMDDPELASGVQRAQKTFENPEGVLYAKELSQILLEAIQLLPTNQRLAMYLRFLREWSYPEVGDELQAPIGSVKTWLFRGRRRVAREFRRRGVLPM